jgi:diguanylate cyclase
MLTKYALGILLISMVASTLATFLSFSFARSLHQSHALVYKKLLGIYSGIIGTGLFLVHYINMLAFNHVHTKSISIPLLIIAFGFAMLIGFTVLDTSNKKSLPFKYLMLGGLQVGIASFGIFFFFAKALLSNNISIQPIPTILAITLSAGIGMLAIITLYWLKNYSGKHPIKIKLMFASLMSAGILGAHIGFDIAIKVGATSNLASNIMLNTQFMSILSALVLIFAFLTAFIIVIFYDKFNQTTAKSFHFGNTKSSYNARLAFDPLTKLPNRDALNQHLALSAKRCERIGDSMALAYIDLDHFKPVNDNFGHHVGDLLLIEVAERFNAAIRNCDYIARAGGDEFVAILGEINAHESIVAVVQRIIDAVKEPFYIEGHFIEISCSVGVAIYPRDGNLEKLKVSADAAMYKAKESGRNQYRFYDAEIEQASDEMQKLRKELLSAIENNEFILHFQPKVDAKTQAPCGAEALLRWNHPTKGLLTPIFFIEAAERFGLIEKINYWVITEACKTIQEARNNHIHLNISVNLSRQQFRNPLLVEFIKGIMAQYDIAPQNLIFEISETHAIYNQNQFKKILSMFKIARLKVSIDDFGLHPFSLTYLQNLEVSEVKLDKSFTSGVAKYASSLAIVEAVVKLAHALNLSVVAEGVETEAQHKALVAAGCNQMQGYFFSKPIPKEKLFDLFRHLEDQFNRTGQFSTSDYLLPESVAT